MRAAETDTIIENCSLAGTRPVYNRAVHNIPKNARLPLHSEELAINVVFQALIRTNTWNCFLEAGCLAKLVDEDEEEIRRILKNRKGEKCYHAYIIFLRSFGIIGRPYKRKTHWCLLGLGALDLTLQDCHHREYVTSAEPKGPML